MRAPSAPLVLAAEATLGIIDPMRTTRRLVGRAHELDRVVGALGLSEGSGGTVVLSGDAGIGKTRLLREVADQARAAGWLVAVGHCVAEAGVDLPYLPFAELIGALREVNADLVDEVARSHPALGQLSPGSPVPQGFPVATGPGQLAEAIHALFGRLAARQGVLLVIEDAHWADHSSRDLLTLLLTRGWGGPLGLVVSYRSDDLHRRHPLHATAGVWARLPGAARLHLEPLAAAEMYALVRDLTDSTDDEAIAGIVRRAAGNAFFAEELAASGNRLGGDLGRVLRSRFEQLDPAAQRVVRAVAVMGRRIGHDLLERVVDASPDELDLALAATIDHQTLEQYGRDSYRFRHALVAEAIRDDLLPGQRRRLHAAFAAALIAEPSLGTASDLARHAAAGGDLETAVGAGIAAGEAALAVGGPREASALFEQVLDWMSDEDPRRDAATEQAALAAAAAGDVTRGVQLIRDRITHSGAESPERARLLSSYVSLGRLLDQDPQHLLQRAREAVLLTHARTDRLRLQALTAEVQALADLGLHREAVDASEVALALGDRLDALDLTTELRTILVACDVEDERDLPGRDQGLLDLVTNRPLDHPTHVRAHYRLGLLQHSRGDLARALDHFDEATAIAERINRPWGVFESSARLHAAVTAYQLGRFDDAVARSDPPGPPFPQPLYAELLAVRLEVLTARDWQVDPALFDSLLPYWEASPMLAMTSMRAEVELVARRGDHAAVAPLAARALDVMQRQWGVKEQVQLRTASVLAALAADLDPAETQLQAALAKVLGPVLEHARTIPARALGAESRSWALRMEAEELFRRWRAGLDVDPDALLAAWRATVESFAGWGNVYEQQRSRVRLSTVLAAGGDQAAARAEAALVTAAAAGLPSEPLRRLLETVPGLATATRRNVAGELTAREREILGLLALGRSNGQIGNQLFISTKTASVHVSNILAKLGASSRGEAVAVARGHGLLTTS